MSLLTVCNSSAAASAPNSAALIDEAMGSEQEALARAGGGSAADSDLPPGGSAEPTGTVNGGPGDPTGGAPPDIPDPRLILSQNGPGVEGCEDEDIVARQLCELATQEEDPFLRADLWDEYNEYRLGTAQ